MRLRPRGRRLPPAAALAALPVAMGAQDAKALCGHYAQAWFEAILDDVAGGLGQAFVERHNQYLARGCVSRRDVCTRSEREKALASRLVIPAVQGDVPRAMPPFGCGG